MADLDLEYLRSLPDSDYKKRMISIYNRENNIKEKSSIEPKKSKEINKKKLNDLGYEKININGYKEKPKNTKNTIEKKVSKDTSNNIPYTIIIFLILNWLFVFLVPFIIYLGGLTEIDSTSSKIVIDMIKTTQSVMLLILSPFLIGLMINLYFIQRGSKFARAFYMFCSLIIIFIQLILNDSLVFILISIIPIIFLYNPISNAWFDKKSIQALH